MIKCPKCKKSVPFHEMHKVRLTVVDDTGNAERLFGKIVTVQKEICEECLGWFIERKYSRAFSNEKAVRMYNKRMHIKGDVNA